MFVDVCSKKHHMYYAAIKLWLVNITYRHIPSVLIPGFHSCQKPLRPSWAEVQCRPRPVATAGFSNRESFIYAMDRQSLVSRKFFCWFLSQTRYRHVFRTSVRLTAQPSLFYDDSQLGLQCLNETRWTKIPLCNIPPCGHHAQYDCLHDIMCSNDTDDNESNNHKTSYIHLHTNMYTIYRL